MMLPSAHFLRMIDLKDGMVVLHVEKLNERPDNTWKMMLGLVLLLFFFGPQLMQKLVAFTR